MAYGTRKQDGEWRRQQGVPDCLQTTLVVEIGMPVTSGSGFSARPRNMIGQNPS